MIGDHVAQCANVFIKTASLLYSDGFRDTDLHVVYVITVPHRFEKAVGETKCENILYGFFTEIVVNAIDLLLAQYAQNISIQGFG